MKTKISYLLSHPIQYFSPLFRQLAASDRIELTVYYCSGSDKATHVDKGFGKTIVWDVPLLEGYRSVFLNNLSHSPSLDNRFWSLINVSIVRRLVKDESEIVIVHGWSYFTNWLAIVTAKLLGKQVWLRGENPLNQEIGKSTVLRVIKKIVLQYGLFKLVNRFLYIGSQNRDFYAFYGVKKQELIYTPYAVDNSFFTAKAQALKSESVSFRLSKQLTADTIIILFSGKYISKKRPLDLLKAYAQLTDKPVALMMVGEGELRGEMEDLIQQFGLKNVFLTGFINQNEIGNYYSMADIFVLPSGLGETWGLVVNEAMLFRLPVVVSATVGCSVDLVRQGENGFVFKEGDVNELSRYLLELVNDSELRRKAGKCSREMIEAFNYSVMVKNIEQAI